MEQQWCLSLRWDNEVAVEYPEDLAEEVAWFVEEVMVAGMD